MLECERREMSVHGQGAPSLSINQQLTQDGPVPPARLQDRERGVSEKLIDNCRCFLEREWGWEDARAGRDPEEGKERGPGHTNRPGSGELGLKPLSRVVVVRAGCVVSVDQQVRVDQD